jgi:hypothetical protein
MHGVNNVKISELYQLMYQPPFPTTILYNFLISHSVKCVACPNLLDDTSHLTSVDEYRLEVSRSFIFYSLVLVTLAST